MRTHFLYESPFWPLFTACGADVATEKVSKDWDKVDCDKCRDDIEKCPACLSPKKRKEGE